MRPTSFLLLLFSVSAWKPRQHLSSRVPLRGKQGFRGLRVRGGFVDGTSAPDGAELAAAAMEWCANLGAPAALVAGAVLATLSEEREALKAHRSDGVWVSRGKRLVLLLLLAAFACEIFSIFATTVTGTMLLSLGDRLAREASEEAKSPMGYMHLNHEFEYLTARITFLQGLLNWLGAISLSYAIPRHDQGPTTRKMNQFISVSLASLCLLMLSFINSHINFYANYLSMIKRYATVVWLDYIWCSPTRPMVFLLAPATAASAYLGIRAFAAEPEYDD